MEPSAFLIASLAKSTASTPKHPNGPGRVVIEPQGRWAQTFDVSGRYNKEPLTWNVETAAGHAGSWLGLAGRGRGLRYEPDDRIALADIASGETLCVLEGIQRPHWGPKPSFGGDYAANSLPAADYSKARPAPFTDIWSLRDGQRVARIDTPLWLGVTLASEQLVAMSTHNTLSIWDLTNGERSARIKGPRARPVQLWVDAGSQRAVSISSNGVVVVWDLAAGAVVAEHKAFAKLCGGPPPHPCLLRGGRRLISQGRFLDVLDLDSGKLDRKWADRDPKHDRIKGIAPVSNGRYVAVLIRRGLFAPNTLEIWDVIRQEQVAGVEVSSAYFAISDNDRVVVASDEELTTFQLQAPSSASDTSE